MMVIFIYCLIAQALAAQEDFYSTTLVRDNKEQSSNDTAAMVQSSFHPKLTKVSLVPSPQIIKPILLSQKSFTECVHAIKSCYPNGQLSSTQFCMLYSIYFAKNDELFKRQYRSYFNLLAGEGKQTQLLDFQKQLASYQPDFYCIMKGRTTGLRGVFGDVFISNRRKTILLGQDYKNFIAGFDYAQNYEFFYTIYLIGEFSQNPLSLPVSLYVFKNFLNSLTPKTLFQSIESLPASLGVLKSPVESTTQKTPFHLTESPNQKRKLNDSDNTQKAVIKTSKTKKIKKTHILHPPHIHTRVPGRESPDEEITGVNAQRTPLNTALHQPGRESIHEESNYIQCDLLFPVTQRYLQQMNKKISQNRDQSHLLRPAND